MSVSVFLPPRLRPSVTNIMPFGATQSLIVTQLMRGLVKRERHYCHYRNPVNSSGGGGKCCGSADRVVVAALV
jgi:hypothetical protein